ncbi:MAG: DUF3108 domain-containing protein [Alphaproteobacteria bacterium]|nr:DUF3108 domain-containing protein [Alphaproteobacteria bacterium]MBV8548461.1 DUF3108 domain-containing protein [Alphaproteobacteria bacterium]
MLMLRLWMIAPLLIGALATTPARSDDASGTAATATATHQAPHKHVRKKAQKTPHQEDMPSRIPVIPPVVTTYDVYVGGIHLLQANILFQEEGNHYRAHVTGGTYGFWHRMFPWDTDLRVAGRLSDDKLLPAQFDTHDTWRSKTKATHLQFMPDGDIIPTFEPPSHDENREQVTKTQRAGALDPISGLLQLLAHTAIDGNCSVTVPIFDGKRLFTITGTDKGNDDIDSEDYGIYSGRARLCDTSFTMVAGDWVDPDNHEKSRFWQKNDHENGREPFHVWLASITPTLPAMPVRLESGSVWGLIVMHLSGWRVATDADLQY